MNKSIDFNALKSAFVLRRVSNMAQRFLNVIYFVGFRLLTVISYGFTISPLGFIRKYAILWSAMERGQRLMIKRELYMNRIRPFIGTLHVSRIAAL